MSKKIYTIIVLIIVFVALYFIWFNYRYVLNDQPRLSNKHYPVVLDSIKIAKQKLSKDKAKLAVLEKKFIYMMNTQIFPYWYGTKWNYYGTTEVPNRGTIACGYFVTTTLRDMGVPINRYKMAQCASEQMIRNLCIKKNIHHLSNMGIDEFEKKLQLFGNGLYIIGLDNHTGYILFTGQENYFIHASGAYPFQVVKEKLNESHLLIKSKYRVVGKISGDALFLKKWVEYKK